MTAANGRRRSRRRSAGRPGRGRASGPKKYSSGEYEIDRDESSRMLNRRDRFVRETGLRGAAYLTFVTTCGVAHNAYWNDIQSEVTLDDLFADV